MQPGNGKESKVQDGIVAVVLHCSEIFKEMRNTAQRLEQTNIVNVAFKLVFNLVCLINYCLITFHIFLQYQINFNYRFKFRRVLIADTPDPLF